MSPEMNMPDWAQHVRPRLSSLRLSPTRENEIVDELSHHLDDLWRELIAGGASPDEATRLALADFREGNLLARYIAPLRQAHAPAPDRAWSAHATLAQRSLARRCATRRGCCASSRALRSRSS